VTGFTFAGIGLSSELDVIAKQYPAANRVGELLYLSPGDEHHISVIELSGKGPARRVRISFEQRIASEKVAYPPCTTVQHGLESQYGPPEIRDFAEEAARRSDRIWRAPHEELTLICFAGGTRLLAEAVVISRR
jgi:hypothetical protein